MRVGHTFGRRVNVGGEKGVDRIEFSALNGAEHEMTDTALHFFGGFAVNLSHFVVQRFHIILSIGPTRRDLNAISHEMKALQFDLHAEL